MRGTYKFLHTVAHQLNKIKYRDKDEAKNESRSGRTGFLYDAFDDYTINGMGTIKGNHMDRRG